MSHDFFHDYKKQFPYTAVAISEDGRILHVVGYPSPPKDADENALVEELKTDISFNMTELEYKKDYTLHTIPSDSELFEEIMNFY